MKKVVLVLLFISVFCIAALAGEVKLYKASSYQTCSSCFVVNAEILVKNIAYNKKVTFVYVQNGSTWRELDAVYVKDAGNGYELWKVPQLSGYIATGTRFAIKYTVGGVTYWDNNDSKDYFLPRVSQLLGPGINVVLNSAQWQSNDFSIYYGSIYVKNINLEKTVDIVYTFDNWQTTKVSRASYFYGADSGNAEIWQFALTNETPGSANLEYAVSYNTGGVNYWDNNFGQDYIVDLTQQ